MNYSEDNDAKVGNEAIVRGLIEMEKYWDALEGDFVRDVTDAGDDETPQKTEHRVNHHVCGFPHVSRRYYSPEFLPGYKLLLYHYGIAGRSVISFCGGCGCLLCCSCYFLHDKE